MIIISTDSKNEPNVAIAGVNMSYVFHTKERNLEMDYEALGKTLVCATLSETIEQLLGSLGDLGEDALAQVQQYLLMFMIDYPAYVEKDVSIIGFYEEELWTNKRFSLVGNAPPGRRIYLSYYDNNADFTDDYILSTYSNSLGGFAFPTISTQKGGRVAIWMELKPSDSLGLLSSNFKYWLNYETKSDISNCTIVYRAQEFEGSRKRYSDISLRASWTPSEYYENNLFAYCIPKGKTPVNVVELLEPTSEEKCLNNIFYAYQKQQRGESLTRRELQIMTKTFSSFPSHFNTKKQEETFRYEDSYEGVLAWSYFYDYAPAASIALSVYNSQGYLDSIVKIDRNDFIYDNNQCDIAVARKWSDSETDSDVRLISMDVDEAELDGYLYLVDPTAIQNKNERDLTCIRNLYLAGRKKEEGVALTDTEKVILKDSAQLAPFDFAINGDAQKVAQKKSFKFTLVWASFYNSLPASQEITIIAELTDELKMTGYAIEMIGLTRPRSVSWSLNWTPASYINNKAFLYVTSVLPSTPEKLIAPTDANECLQNIMWASQAQTNQITLSDEQLGILEQSFNGAPYSVEYGGGNPTVSESDTYAIAWSGFYNFSHPQNPWFGLTWETVCLSGDTLITLADGSKKRLDQMIAGDKVLGQDGVTVVENLKIMPANSFYYIYHFEDGIDIKETSPHRFYNVEQGFSQKLSKWEIGEHALHEDGRHIALLSKEQIIGEELKYGLYTESGTYYANGLLSSPMFANKLELTEASIDKVINMVTSIDTARALKFAKTGDY